MFFYGYGSAFECRVLQVAPERSPWHQVRAAVFVRDALWNGGMVPPAFPWRCA